jgi:hypothetical protein
LANSIEIPDECRKKNSAGRGALVSTKLGFKYFLCRELRLRACIVAPVVNAQGVAPGPELKLAACLYMSPPWQ